MDVIVWILAGGALGWVAFSYMGLSEDRGMMISVIIGAVGGVFGGKLIAPMFAGAAVVPEAFSMTGLLFAAVVATAFLVVGNLVYNRWDV
jgi:uncharacterized membrane protein YeaQ/YmgE (transglycosylase-associated protein family)